MKLRNFVNMQVKVLVLKIVSFACIGEVSISAGWIYQLAADAEQRSRLQVSIYFVNINIQVKVLLLNKCQGCRPRVHGGKSIC